MNHNSQLKMNNQTKMPFYKNPLNKTLFYSFIWAFGFAFLLPTANISLWQYTYFIGSVPSMLLSDMLNMQHNGIALLVAMANSLILLIPYFYYLKTQQQYWWLYWSISLYGFINASLGFTIIISMIGITH